MSKVYDLVNTSLQIYEPRIFALERGLFKEGMYLAGTNQISNKDFEEFGRRIGLPQKLVDQEIVRFATPNDEADALINRSYLSPTMKKYYLSSYHYRQSMIRPR